MEARLAAAEQRAARAAGSASARLDSLGARLAAMAADMPEAVAGPEAVAKLQRLESELQGLQVRRGGALLCAVWGGVYAPCSGSVLLRSAVGRCP